MNDLAPGVQRLRPDDHFMILSETDASPMHVGALVMLDVPDDQKPQLAQRLRHHFTERLPATPLQVRLVRAPEGFDSDVWANVASVDWTAHLVEEETDDLHQAVAYLNMERLDLAHPPFKVHVFARQAAFYVKMHHAVADGIGFQEVLRLLTDDAPAVAARTLDAVLPDPQAWMAMAQARFAAEEQKRAEQSEARKAAFAVLEAFKGRRAETPELKLSGATSGERRYTRISVPLDRFKMVARALDATVNDLFLACAGTALRAWLIEQNDLPASPLVVNSARSWRRPEHGSFGNRIVAQHPHIATHIADPIDRLRAIQGSMAAEMERTQLDEALLDALEKPYGARDRRAAFAERTAGGKRVLPGNITLSNVPGPGGSRSYAGYAQRHNFPVPIIGSGRFLNITSRRSGDNLDMGLIADAQKVRDVERIADLFRNAVQTYASLAGH